MSSCPPTDYSPDAREQRTEPLPGARQALVLLLLVNLFNYIDRYVLAAVVPHIKRSLFADSAATSGLQPLLDWCQQHLGFKPENALIGVLSMAFMVSYMVCAPLFARLAETRSRWLLIGIGVMLWSLASGASGLATVFVALLLTRCFVGVGEGAYGPTAPAIISDLYPVQVRGRVLSWFYLALPVGTALGYVLGDVVGNSSLGATLGGAFGLHTESWRWAFFLVVPPGLVLAAVCLLRREPVRGQADLASPAPARKLTWQDYRILLRTPSYLYCTFGMTAMTFAMGGIAFWMPYYLAQRSGAQLGATTKFGAIVVASGLAGTLLGGWAGDRLRPRFPGSYFLVSGLAMLLGFPLMLSVLHTPFPWIWPVIFLTCFCLFFNTGPTNTILANVTHPALRSAGFALNILVIHALGDVISPVIIGIVSDRYSMNAGFAVVGLMFLVAASFWFLGARHLAHDTALAPTRLSGLCPSTPSVPPGS